MEEWEDGKKEYKRNDKGTPQGGVISPLLANIYLNVLDTLWVVKEVQERLGARLRGTPMTVETKAQLDGFMSPST